MNKPMRSHPINIIERTSKYLVLLLLPLLRTLWGMFHSFYFDEIFSWLVSVRWTLAIVAVILFLGWYEWYRFRFTDSKEGLIVSKGILFKQETLLRYESVTSVCVIRPWYYRPLHVVQVSVDTDAGRYSQTDFSVTISRKYAWQLLDTFQEVNVSTIDSPSFYIPDVVYITFFSVLTSNLITGAFYLAVSVSQIGRFLGQDIGKLLLERFTKIISYIQLGIPPVVTFIFWSAIVLWGYSFLHNLERTLRFTVMRRENLLTITSGIVNRRRNLVHIPNVNALLLQQNLICRPFGIYSAALSCTGYGIKTGTANVLLPAGSKKQIKKDWAKLFPEFELTSNQITAKKGCKRYFIGLIIISVSVLAALIVILSILFPGFRLTICGIGIVIEIPLLWLLLARCIGLQRVGVAKTENGYVFRYVKGFRLMTASVPEKRISQILIYASFFQKRYHCCHLWISLYGEQRMHIWVPCLDPDEVRNLFNL